MGQQWKGVSLTPRSAGLLRDSHCWQFCILLEYLYLKEQMLHIYNIGEFTAERKSENISQ